MKRLAIGLVLVLTVCTVGVANAARVRTPPCKVSETDLKGKVRLRVDRDCDGLSNRTERKLRTDPRDADTDDDGVRDGDEVLVLGTDPRDADTDDDGVEDGDDACPSQQNAGQCDDDDASGDDEGGSGFDPGDTRSGLADMNAVLGTSWTDARREHPDYVERYGITACMDCHLVESVGYADDYAPGCLTCHGAKFCGTPGSESLAICRGDWSTVVVSAGTLDMNAVLGVNWLIPSRSHGDYVERFGVSACVGCHDPEVGGKPSASTWDAQGCLSCHGPVFCGTSGSSGLAICANAGDGDHD